MCITVWKKYFKILRYSSFRGIIQCGPLLITFGLTFDHIKESVFHKIWSNIWSKGKMRPTQPWDVSLKRRICPQSDRRPQSRTFCAMSLLLLTLDFVDEIDKNLCNKINSYFQCYIFWQVHVFFVKQWLSKTSAGFLGVLTQTLWNILCFPFLFDLSL